MSKPWAAEHPVDAALARRLVAAQFPALATVAPERVGEGFDSDVWRFGELAFRFPRRPMGVELLTIERRALPELASRLPVPIPVPLHDGRAVPDFPHPFYAYRLLPGLSADRAGLDVAGREALVPAVASFLKALHGLDAEEARSWGVPEDTFRGPVDRLRARVQRGLAALEGSPYARHFPAIEALASIVPPNATESPVVCHGDLYARHLLLDEAGGLAGVIDWGDVCVGDRAIDLAWVYTFLPPRLRPLFWRHYGEVDAATRSRARLSGLSRYGMMLLAYAIDMKDGALEREAAIALTFALAEDAPCDS